MADERIRRDEQLLCGRLVAMPSTSTLEQLNALQSRESGTFLSIDFPAMPDVIELARSAEYATSSTINTPDGIHQYKGTKPLEIPVSFRIHSFDQQYLKKGALTLLQLSARLHSFILPISQFSASRRLAPTAGGRITNGKSYDAAVEAAASQNNVSQVGGGNTNKVGGLYAPVTCWLHLMWTASDKPGISAMGYLREVSVKFNGPWLRGPSNSFNLPTSADFSFTFIHVPGYGNDPDRIDSQFPPSLAQSGQAFADDVKDRLYNTRSLVHAFNYQGLQGDDAAAAPPPDQPAPTPTIQQQQLVPPINIPAPVIIEPIT